jgi:hypothetical protein
MKKKADPKIKTMIVKLVYGNLADEDYDKLSEWGDKNYKLFMKELKRTINEKYEIYWKK